MRSRRHPLRNLLIGCGITLITVAGIYLVAGLFGLVPLELEAIKWNNIRIISGVAILGCLMAAMGYGNE
jgi:hypothetical protein